MISVLDHLIGLSCLAYGTNHRTIRLSWHVRASSVTVSRNLLQIVNLGKNTDRSTHAGDVKYLGHSLRVKNLRIGSIQNLNCLWFFVSRTGQGFTVRGVNQPRNKVMSCSTSPKVTMNHGPHRISTRHRCKGATCVNFQNIWIARNDLVLF